MFGNHLMCLGMGFENLDKFEYKHDISKKLFWRPFCEN